MNPNTASIMFVLPGESFPNRTVAYLARPLVFIRSETNEMDVTGNRK